ncbi:hypothetical protein P12x_005084 [Tundrisphaera lichenicola]|uniref:hypothetical protein n=1 Tax=Tundrisphaera lichenicola TaxID=2029860 RepID=UPI003EBDA82A
MMPEPDETHFTCIGCGESVPVGSDLCPGCRHPFREPIPATSPEEWLSIPDEASRMQAIKAPTIGIGTAMIPIAMVAVCLGAILASPILGVFASLGILPASIRTANVSARRRAQGFPLGVIEKFATFVMTIGAAYLVAFASLAAYLVAFASLFTFVVTCFPIGILSLGGGPRNQAMGVYLGVGAGLIVAIFVGISLSRLLLRTYHRESRSERSHYSDRGPQ